MKDRRLRILLVPRSVWLTLNIYLALQAACGAGSAWATPAAAWGGMAATSHPMATAAATAMLQAGGSACDAAVAAALTLAVVEPACSGLGGGGMALVGRDGHPEEARMLDFREVAPMAATADMFARAGAVARVLARDTGLGVAVPGAVAGFVALHQQCGVLPWPTVVAPARQAALHGFEADLRFVRQTEFRLPVVRDQPGFSEVFLVRDANGAAVPPAIGTLIRQTALAGTLARLAYDRGEAFYRGDDATALVRAVQAAGGVMQAGDLAAYAPIWRTPLVGTYAGHKVVGTALPSSGGIEVLLGLNMMAQRPPDAPWHSDPWLRFFIEGQKVAAADRLLLTDPAALADPEGLSQALIDPGRAALLAPLVGSTAIPPNAVWPGLGTSFARPQPGDGVHTLGRTTHVSVMDAQGLGVALTTSLNMYWGSGVFVPASGVVLNDQMMDFSLDPTPILGRLAPVNVIAPGKRPLSSMAPTLVFGPEGRLQLVVGSPGGARIPSMVLQILLNLIDEGVELDTAIAQRRLAYNPLTDNVEYERFALEPLSLASLGASGYRPLLHFNWGNATAVWVDPISGLRTGAADMRGVGRAEGVARRAGVKRD